MASSLSPSSIGTPHLFQEKLTWAEAQAHCQSLGGALPSIQSKHWNDVLYNLTGGETTWIGLSDIKSEGDWVWSDGSSLNFTYWGVGEADGAQFENCGAFWEVRNNDRWFDMTCEDEYQFICLLPSPPPPPSPPSIEKAPRLFQEKLTWAEAQAHCQSLGGELPSIQSKHWNDVLYNLTGGETTWIGLSDIKSEGDWVWSDGSSLNFSYWGVGEPDGAQFENCGAFWEVRNNDKWFDMTCEDEYQFICLLPSPPPPPSPPSIEKAPHLFQEKLAWAEARAHCQSLGGELPSIQSKHWNDVLYNLTGGETTWIGLSDIESEGDWVWSDGSSLNFSYWGVGEPDGAQFENCGAFWEVRNNDKWFDMTCEDEYQFICLLPSPPSAPSLSLERTPHLFEEKLTWAEARTHCQSLGGELPSIHSEHWNDVLYNLTGGETTWIGLSDIENEGDWVWSDGAGLGFTYWGVGEPDGAQFENCGAFCHHRRLPVMCVVLLPMKSSLKR
ncbi:hypothetical protein AB1Y20_012050 [Prymnesium parvum]|uniref:C-type lectin domain-containing protein n=1 Tax=Prymnesium parvum TaxID=97485 RepID=A0AB34IND6_PRYPA